MPHDYVGPQMPQFFYNIPMRLISYHTIQYEMPKPTNILSTSQASIICQVTEYMGLWTPGLYPHTNLQEKIY